MIILSLFSFPVYCSTEEKAMIYYSEETLTAGDTVHLEQGYSFKLIDASEDSGDILVQVYYKDEEIEIGDSFGDEDDPFEYMIPIEERDGDEEEETDYVVIRIRPVDFDDKDDGIHVEVEIEQFLDPEQEDDDFLLLDTSKSVKVGESLSLEEGYTLDASDMEDDSVVLELSRNGKSLKKEELEIDDIFSYSKSVDDNVRTIFIARVSKFFESSASSTVILKDVTQRPDMEEDHTEEVSENESNKTEPLMSVPDDTNYIMENKSNNTTADAQNASLSDTDGQNSSKTSGVNTDHFMPILFLVIIAIGIVIFKLS